MPQQVTLFKVDQQARREKREELERFLKMLGLAYHIEDQGYMLHVKVWWD